MTTINQLSKKPRVKKGKQTKSPALKQCPQSKGVCLRVTTRQPKKPNSAKRKITTILLTNKVKTTGYIPGEAPIHPSLLQQDSKW